MDELQLWEKLRDGDMLGLRGLYDLHVDPLYAYGMALCQDEDKVKDCIQELFLSFWQNHSRLTIPRSGKAYLMVSLRRRIFDQGPKSQAMTGTLEDTELERLGQSPDHVTAWILEEEESAQLQKLEAALSRISERQREIIHMKYYQKMEYDDIARIMNLNYQSARNLVTRALMALRKEMALILWILWWIK